MSKTLKILAAAVSVAAMAGAASATVNVAVPAANYIVFGGHDWAWAGPCAPFAGDSCNSSGTNTLTAFQAALGWRIPTRAEFLAKPAWSDFGGKCASPYFGSGYNHCDFGDGQGGYIWDYGYNIQPPGKGTHPAAETWFIRGAGQVPEPASWALMLLGVGGLGATLRGQRRTAAVAA